MDHFEERELRNRVQLATQRAHADPAMKITGVGEEAGMSIGEITRVRESGTGGIKKIQCLAEILSQRGFMDEPSDVSVTSSADMRISSSKDDPASTIALKLRALADYLESPAWSSEDKIEEFSATVKSLYDRLDSIVRAFTKSGNGI